MGNHTICSGCGFHRYCACIVVISYTSIPTNITIGVAAVIVNVIGKPTGCTTNIAICITAVVVNMFGNPTGCTAYVTICIASVVIHMLCYANRATNIAICIAAVVVNMFGNPTGCTADVTICIASVVIHVLCYANRATDITIGIATVVVNVFGNPTGYAANVTTGIALVIICMVNHRNNILFHEDLTAIAALFAFGQTGIDAVGFFFGQSDCVFVCALCFANKATYVTSCIVFIIVGMVNHRNNILFHCGFSTSGTIFARGKSCCGAGCCYGRDSCFGMLMRLPNRRNTIYIVPEVAFGCGLGCRIVVTGNIGETIVSGSNFNLIPLVLTSGIVNAGNAITLKCRPTDCGYGVRYYHTSIQDPIESFTANCCNILRNNTDFASLNQCFTVSFNNAITLAIICRVICINGN